MKKQMDLIMKLNDSILQARPHEEAMVSIYPLELVADVAAKVLCGTEYPKAAKTAIALLDACQKELLEQTHKRATIHNAEKQRKSKYAGIERDHNKNFVIKPFKEALKIITGEVREERAFPKYKRFLAHQIHQSRATDVRLEITKVAAPIDADVEAKIKQYKNEGIRHDVVLGQQQAFEDWKKVDASEIARKRATGGTLRKNKA